MLNPAVPASKGTRELMYPVSSMKMVALRQWSNEIGYPINKHIVSGETSLVSRARVCGATSERGLTRVVEHDSGRHSDFTMEHVGSVRN